MEQIIQDYLDGKLSEQDRIAFEANMKEDAELAQEVADLQLLENGLSSLGATQFAAEVGGWEQEYRASQQEGGIIFGEDKPGRGIIFRQTQWLTAAVVSLLVLSAAAWWMLAGGQDTQEVYAAYYTPYEDMILVRGDTLQGVESMLRMGMEAYNAGEYAAAIGQLEAYRQAVPDDFRPFLYIGIAQAEQGETGQADANFKKAMEDPNYRQQAQWYQALTYLKTDQQAAAIQSFESIAGQNPVHYRQQEAKKILTLLQ